MQTLENAMRRAMIGFTNREMARFLPDREPLPDDATSDDLFAAQFSVLMERDRRVVNYLVGDGKIEINTRNVPFPVTVKHNDYHSPAKEQIDEPT